MSYHAILHHIIPYHTIHYIKPHKRKSSYLMLYYITLYHTIPYITSHNRKSSHIMPYYTIHSIILYHIKGNFTFCFSLSLLSPSSTFHCSACTSASFFIDRERASWLLRSCEVRIILLSSVLTISSVYYCKRKLILRH